jgi:hypothetical protein
MGGTLSRHPRSCQALNTWTIKTPVPRTPPLCYTPHARVKEQSAPAKGATHYGTGILQDA